MKSLFCLPAAVSLAAIAISSHPASAQSRSAPTEAPSADVASDSAQAPNATAAPGPVIFVIDSTRHLAIVNVGSLVVRRVCRAGVQLTDIAFNPTNRKLYGISYNALYEVQISDCSTRLVARLGVNDANALVFDSAGRAYFAGYTTNRLYRLNVTTGRATIIGLTGPYLPAGDLTFYNDRLVMSATYKTTSPNARTDNYLVTLNPANAAIVGTPVLLGIHQLYGLASTGKNELYGLAAIGTSFTPGLYQLFPAASSLPNRDTLLRNLSSTGLSLIVGTAYNGNYQP
jgi:hypothetical protein